MFRLIGQSSKKASGYVYDISHIFDVVQIMDVSTVIPRGREKGHPSFSYYRKMISYRVVYWDSDCCAKGSRDSCGNGYGV